MANTNSTQLNQGQIDTQAQLHDQMADTVTKQMQNLKGEVDATLAASPSQATRALQSTFDTWMQSVQTVSVNHLRLMADEIRHAASSQTAQDEANLQAIMHVPMDTASFLGIGNL